MSDLRTVEIADALLTAVEEAATSLSIDLPERRVVAEGNLAWDCALVAVALPRSFRGQPGAAVSARNRTPDTFVADYRLWVLRDVPVPSDDGRLPAPEAISEAGRATLADHYLLTVGLAPALAEIAKGCTSIATGEVTTSGPEGGLVGVSAVVAVGL